MNLVPTPLPTAVAHLLTSAARVSTLVQPAFGLQPNHPCSPSPADGSSKNNNDNNDESNIERSSSREEREAKAQKRAIRVQYDLGNAISLLEQLRWVVDETGVNPWGEIPLLEPLRRVKDDGKRTSRWGEIPLERKGLVQAREMAAVLGAGGVVLRGLEGALRELGRLYETEREIRGNKEKGVEEKRDANVVRWLRHETRQEVWEMMRGLKDLGAAVWFVLTVLESPSDDDVATSRKNLRAAVAEILGKDNTLSRKVKELYPEPEAGLAQDSEHPTSINEASSTGLDLAGVVRNLDVSDDSDSDSEAGPPTPSSSEFPFPDTAVEGSLNSLADTAVDDILVPVPVYGASEPTDADTTTSVHTPTSPSPRDSAPLKVITVSPTGVDISPLPSDLDPALPQPSTAAVLSADAVFQLPDVTDQVILDFFHRALHVSRFASHFSSGGMPQGSERHPSTSQQHKLEGLSSRYFRELCTDLYDELVRRNVADQNKDRRDSAEQVMFFDPKGLHVKRVDARRRLALLRDEQLVKMIGLVVGELERRCLASASGASSISPRVQELLAREELGNMKGSARLSAVQGDRWSSEAVWGAQIWLTR